MYVLLVNTYRRRWLDGLDVRPRRSNHSDRERVRLSGLWTNNDVDEAYNPSFFAEMERRIDVTDPQ